MPEIVSEQRTDAWHEARRGMMTASIAAAALGFCPYVSAKKAWRTIVHGERDEPNKFMAWGTRHESTARLAYECETGVFVKETGFWVSEEFPWLGASPDGLIGDDGLLEIKIPGTMPGEVPLHHRIQIIVQLVVTKRKWCDYYAWNNEGSLCCRVYPSGASGIVRRLKEWMDKYVATKEEPPRASRKTSTKRRVRRSEL